MDLNEVVEEEKRFRDLERRIDKIESILEKMTERLDEIEETANRAAAEDILYC